jgi:DNA modification methylase
VNHAVLCGDAVEKMGTMEEKSVHACWTSVPYWQLRSYIPKDSPLKPLEIGSEPTPALYVENLRAVFRQVRRVLRPDGLLWVNINGTYCSNPGQRTEHDKAGAKQESNPGSVLHQSVSPDGWQSGDYIDTPAMLADALRLDGWVVRCKVIWAKSWSFADYSGSCMPESPNGTRWERHRVKVSSDKKRDRIAACAAGENVGMRNHSGTNYEQEVKYADCPGCPECLPNDGLILRHGRWRPTRSYETLLMLSGPGDYYSDKYAVMEGNSPDMKRRSAAGHTRGANGKLDDGRGDADTLRGEAAKEITATGRNLRSVWEVQPGPLDIWTLNPEPSSIAHYAMAPSRLIIPCIKSSTAPHVCAKCGAPWARVVALDGKVKQQWGERASNSWEGVDKREMPQQVILTPINRTLGFRPTCTCAAGKARAVVLDCFAGVAGTGLVCKALGRDFIGTELNPTFVEIGRQRLAGKVSGGSRPRKATPRQSSLTL